MLHSFNRVMSWRLSGLALALLLGACVTQSRLPLQKQCTTSVVALEARFAGGGMTGCRIVSETHIEIVIAPEDIPINPSPWYAVRLTPRAAGDIVLTLVYEHHRHRYRPKLIAPDGAWEYVAADKVTLSKDMTRARVALTLTNQPLIVAGQEVLTAADYDRWMSDHAAQTHVDQSSIGQSVEGRPIHMLSTRAQSSRGSVVLVGRQHPPELTGAVAMLAFVDEVFGASELAVSFRHAFNVVAVPLMNPDGVRRGHWRHNVAGTDLNRDWGPFEQPETTALLKVLNKLAAQPANRPVLFLDFHSTNRNVFYTQLIGADGTPYGFTAKWLAQSRARLDDYSFERAERNQTTLATSKNYVHGRFSIPAITYEVGDETDRAATRQAARVFAQEMMRVLLEEHDANDTY